LEIIAAVAIGLNPYVGTFLLAALAAFTDHVPLGPLGAALPASVLALLAVVTGLAVPIDFVLGKFVRFAPAVRRTSQFVAPAGGGLLAASLTQSELPLALVAGAGGFLSWAIAAMLTSAAARASRSAAWVGLGHIPVLMAAATAAACIVPLGLAKTGLGLGLAGVAAAMLAWSTVSALRAAPRARTLPQAGARLASRAIR
jgi:hypothetical protein